MLFVLLLGLSLVPALFIFMNNETKSETFYWPDRSSGELFKYEYIAEVYYSIKMLSYY